MGTISKGAFIDAIAKRAGATQVDARIFVDAFVAEITEQASAGRTVRLQGFGAFVQKTSAARVGRNPKTGEPVDIPERKKITFKASKPA